MPRDGWTGKQNAVDTNSGVLFSLKKDGNSDTCHNTDEPWRHYAKWDKPGTKGQLVLHGFSKYTNKEKSLGHMLSEESKFQEKMPLSHWCF